MPQNAGTARRYSGINVLILWAEGIAKGYASQRWLTYRQAEAAGGNVIRGEKGTVVCYADRFIFEEFADSIALATMSWKKKGRIDKIILYGSYARGGWVDEPHTAKGYRSDFDLLIIVSDIRRQQKEWQREATRELATGRTDEAIGRYADAGFVHVADTRVAARAELVDAWDRDRQAHPDASRIILTHTNDEREQLNDTVRERLKAGGALGNEVALNVERGERSFAAGDRIMFLKNDRDLGVKNGSLGSVGSVGPARMTAMLDDGRRVAFDLKDYAHIDHGYRCNMLP